MASAHAFIQRILDLPSGPGVSLDPVLQPFLDDETQLRVLFASERAHPRLADPHVGLVDLFNNAPVDLRITRARVVNEQDANFKEKYIIPIPDIKRRAEGTSSMVGNIAEFRAHLDAFSEGSLGRIPWTNVIVAGGSVLACLTPLSDEEQSAPRAHYSRSYPNSDIDLFLYGLTSEEAEEKIINIYHAVRGSVPDYVRMTCVRTKHTVSIHSEYPFRTMQIVLRLYASPAEILAGFDIDAACCAYDGDRVYASPRAVIAIMRQANTIDMTRRSPSYETRLAKYAIRNFEIYVPNLSRADIDPMIYQRSTKSLSGLARLLSLEMFVNNNGDLPSVQPLGHSSDYDVESLHIPSGPHRNVNDIDTLVCVTNMGMNSFAKLQMYRIHRHPAFCGDIETVLEDCCRRCPTPLNASEEELDDKYLRGRITFIQDDPGRQMLSGSFNPVDVGEWSLEAYFGPTEHLFAAIAANDHAGIVRMVALILIRMVARMHTNAVGL